MLKTLLLLQPYSVVFSWNNSIYDEKYISIIKSILEKYNQKNIIIYKDEDYDGDLDKVILKLSPQSSTILGLDLIESIPEWIPNESLPILFNLQHKQLWEKFNYLFVFFVFFNILLNDHSSKVWISKVEVQEIWNFSKKKTVSLSDMLDY